MKLAVPQGGTAEALIFSRSLERSLGLENVYLSGDNPTMTVTADDKRRVVLPGAKPGDRFDLVPSAGGFVLRKLQPAPKKRARVRIEKRAGYTVGITDQPINEQALKEALAEFP